MMQEATGTKYESGSSWFESLFSVSIQEACFLNSNNCSFREE